MAVEISLNQQLGQLERRLRALPKEISGKGATGPLAKALKASAEVVKTEAQNLVHVGREHSYGRRRRPGTLKRAIIVRRARNPQTRRGGPQEVMKVVVRTGGTKSGFGAWYWHFEEFGTIRREAHPFLRPALANKKGEALSVFTGKLKRAIELAENKVRRMA